MDTRPLTFPQTHRLKTPAQFNAVYDARTREARGPLMVYGLPNALGHPRLGLSVSRKVGVAPRRNRIKRLLREAFRAQQYDLPVGYNWVIVVRPHEPMLLVDYQRLLSEATKRLHAIWERRELQPKPPSTGAAGESPMPG